MILFVVVYHAFCIYDNKWDLPKGLVQIDGYQWISRFAYGFALEAFVLMAGYLYAFQCFETSTQKDFLPIALKKFRRLWIPALLFGVLYVLCFYNLESLSILSFLKTIFNGAGHLWFLPMLFWCYLGGWILHRLNLNKWGILAVLFLLSIAPINFNFLGLGYACQYLFYFYLGYIVWIKQTHIEGMLRNSIWIVVFALLFVGILIIRYMWIDPMVLDSNRHGVVKGFMLLGRNFSRDINALAGLFALFFLIKIYVSRPSFRLSKWVVTCGSLCFGIYIFHQFILKWLYYKTTMSMVMDSHFLPFVAALVALVISTTIAFILIKTRVGRSII